MKIKDDENASIDKKLEGANKVINKVKRNLTNQVGKVFDVVEIGIQAIGQGIAGLGHLVTGVGNVVEGDRQITK